VAEVVVETLNHQDRKAEEVEEEEAVTQLVEEVEVVVETQEEYGTRQEVPTVEMKEMEEVEVEEVADGVETVMVVDGEVVVVAAATREPHCLPTIGGRRMGLVIDTTEVVVDTEDVVEEEEEEEVMISDDPPPPKTGLSQHPGMKGLRKNCSEPVTVLLESTSTDMRISL